MYSARPPSARPTTIDSLTTLTPWVVAQPEVPHDPLTHAESPALKIDARVLQNHLEQLVAFALVLFGLSTVLGAQHLQLLPISTGVFVVGRFIYWRGYHRQATLGRAPGVQLTLFVTLPLLILTVVLTLWQASAWYAG